jgi:hypothetical protein
LTVVSSILFTTTMSTRTPSVFASSACSRVWPPFSNPVSNSPRRAEITSTAMSACAAPAIMLATKDLCPGASRIVKRLLGVVKVARPTSTAAKPADVAVPSAAPRPVEVAPAPPPSTVFVKAEPRNEKV